MTDVIIPPYSRELAADRDRPIVNNPDGSISTEQTITVEADGKHHVIPTVYDGAHHTNEEAIARNLAPGGEVFASFDNAAAAETYAQQRHLALQDELLGSHSLVGSDVGADYKAHRDDLSKDDALQRALAWNPDPKPVEPPQPGVDGAAPAATPDEQHMGLAGPFTTTDLKQGAAVVKDVGRGAIEGIPSALGGVHDAFKNLAALGDDIAAWLTDKTGVGDKGLLSYWSANPTPASKTAIEDVIPAFGKENPNSVTGGFIKSTAQFLTGFKGADKALKAFGMVKTGGQLMSMVKAGLTGFTAFDPHEKRLADLIQKYPALQNPVTEYLASDPTDSDAEGRFKTAIEQTGLGVLAEGFVKAVGILRDVQAAKRLAADPNVQNAQNVERVLSQPDVLPEEQLKGLLGDPNEPLVSAKAKAPSTTTATAESVTQAAGAEGPPKGETFINFSRMDTDEDVQKVMQHLADAGPPAAGEARAGVRGFKQVELDAAHENAYQNMLKERPAGQPLSDSESLAARQLWNATTTKTAELAKAAYGAPSEANLFAFRKMLAIQDSVQRHILAARAAAGRSLASWRITAGTGAERLQEVMAALDNSGGSEVARELARRYNKLAQAGMVKELTAFTSKTAYARTRDAVLEGWINGLLSNPATHIVNTLSNSIVIGMRMAERATAAKLSQVLGTQDGVAAGEAGAQWFGLQQGAKEMFSYYAKMGKLFLNEDVQGLKTAANENPVRQLGYSANKVQHPVSISSDAFKISSETPLGRAVDLAGQVVRAPGSALQLEDEFFKTVGYRMELNAQALRQATSEAQSGMIASDAVRARAAELVANPTESLRLQAVDAATYQTFTSTSSELSRTLARATARFPLLKVILPFTRTPSNILKFTFERTPLAPAMSSFRREIRAGGARRDLALAQMALGTMAMTTFADMTMGGYIRGRGPVKIGERQTAQRMGQTSYSVNLGKLSGGEDRWVQVSRLDPVGGLIGMAADATEMMMAAQEGVIDDVGLEKVVAAGVLAFAGNLTNKTYLSGLSSIIATLNDPTRYSERYIQRMAGSVVPSGVAAVERIQDPNVRAVYDMMDAIKARTPGLSEDLPSRLDLWGEPMKQESGLGKGFDFFTPAYSQKPSNEPIDHELQRLDSNITMPVTKTSFNGVKIDLSHYPKAYMRYVELAGNGLKHPAWGLGAKDLLNKVVTGKHPLSQIYQLKSDGPDGDKDKFIQDTIENYRKLARNQLLREFPEIKKEVDRKREEQRKLHMPVIQ